MAISIDWATKVITVPRNDMTLVSSTPFEVRELDVNTFRQSLNALQASDEGMPFDTTHIHNTSVTVGGISLARVVQLVNDYTVTFEDGSYAVNLIGANNNIADVLNLNSVQVRSSNSAGLVETGISGLTVTESNVLSRLLDLLESDQDITSSNHTFFLKNTTDILMRKAVSGSQIAAANVTLTDNTP